MNRPKITCVEDLHLETRTDAQLQRLLRAFTPAVRIDAVHEAIAAEIAARQAEQGAQAELQRRLDLIRARLLARRKYIPREEPVGALPSRPNGQRATPPRPGKPPDSPTPSTAPAKAGLDNVVQFSDFACSGKAWSNGRELAAPLTWSGIKANSKA
jgi:hypothetical protein